MKQLTIKELLLEYDRALEYTNGLWSDLTDEEISWRDGDQASAIGWHLGHQPAVAHYLVRNLTAAEPSIDVQLDKLMDSATPETARGAIPNADTLTNYRDTVAERVRFTISQIDAGKVGAPAQLRAIASNLMLSVINHEYQHSKWIGEIRTEVHGRNLPTAPSSDHITIVDGYYLVT